MQLKISLTMLALFVSSCGFAVNQAAICDGSARLRTDHAAALVQDGGDRSVLTGAALIRAIDAGCAAS